MFDVICPAFLDRYARWVQQLADENPECWGLIYQADVRARLEHAPDVRERLEDEHADALVNSRRTKYEESRPWNLVWYSLVKEEKDYWYKSVEKPGLLILAGTAKPAHFIEDDALVKRPAAPITGGDTRPTKQHRYEPNATTAIVPYVPPPPNPAAGKGKGGRKGAEDWSVHDGQKYLKNRAGASICKGYQSGACCRQNSWNLCSSDGVSAHQCEVCLMVGHGSSEQNKCPRQKARKGKGAGRGGARGGAGRGRGRGRGTW